MIDNNIINLGYGVPNFKSSKHFEYMKLFVLGNIEKVFCVILEENIDENCYEVVTAFPTDENYLVKYQEVWSWRGGNPSS